MPSRAKPAPPSSQPTSDTAMNVGAPVADSPMESVCTAAVGQCPLLQHSSSARRCEFHYDVSTSAWHRCVLGPLSAEDNVARLFYVNENSVTEIEITPDLGDRLRLPLLEWKPRDEKRARTLVEQLEAEVSQQAGADDDSSEEMNHAAKSRKQRSAPPQKAKLQLPLQPPENVSGRVRRVAAVRAVENARQQAKAEYTEDDGSGASSDSGDSEAEFTSNKWQRSAKSVPAQATKPMKSSTKVMAARPMSGAKKQQAKTESTDDDESDFSPDPEDSEAEGLTSNKRQRPAAPRPAKPTTKATKARPVRAKKQQAKAQSTDDDESESSADSEDSEAEGFTSKKRHRRAASKPTKKLKPVKAISKVKMAPPVGGARKRPSKQSTQPFVDPAGLDIEDRGVEWIVEMQCEKLMPLIEEAVKHDELRLSMATACSGTDSPVVAMRVAQEMLSRRGINFSFEHVMSCEIEPYKQSFIARNNPGVLLFPDICALGLTPVGEEATTVFGGKANVPSATMIVAGTSCKDFSNLKGRDRKSIEAMGTSGETFIGFVDLLFQQRYALAILENVQGAEWDKMAHYITGVLPLHSIRPNKGAAGRGVPSELAFEVEKDGLRVVEVSQFAGVRLGARLLASAVVFERGDKGLRAVEGGKRTPIQADGNFKRGQKVGLERLKATLRLDDTHALIFETPVEYATRLAHMDAKEFGLPQTRTRNYMFIWRPELLPPGLDIGARWTELVDALRCPLKYSVDAFLLADDNDRVRRFRDALRGPLGRLTAMSRQSGDWWGANANKDTEHTKAYRACTLSDKSASNCLLTPAAPTARPLTNWAPNGVLSLASPRWWPEYISVLSQRELDLSDCFGLKAAETGIDALHHSLWWNISQNVGRTDVIPRPGITGCITPGGEPYGPHVGRSILGYEKLLLSGIPADKLLLGTESEVQLSDLAGNAMAMPVVSAAILAALLLPAYARLLARGDFSLDNLAPTESRVPVVAPTPPKCDHEPTPAGEAKGSDLADRLLSLLPLCAAAEATSILCTCETSGGMSASGVVRCSDCQLTACRSCGARVDLRSHEAGAPAVHPFAASEAARHVHGSPAAFEQKLRTLAPTALILDSASVAALRSRGAEVPGEGDSDEGGYSYRLSRVQRERGCWTLGYTACDPQHGTPVAELRVSVGQLGPSQGVGSLLYSFVPALRGERGRMPPIARLLLLKGESVVPCWEILGEPRPCEIRLEVLSDVPSYRSELGLLHYKDERWPGTLRLEGEADVAGVYERQPCRFSCVFGALWRRRTEIEGQAPLWLLVRPTIDRTAPDQLILSSSPSYRDCDWSTRFELRPTDEADMTRPFDLLTSLTAPHDASPVGKKRKTGCASAASCASIAAREVVWEPLEATRFHAPVDPTRIQLLDFGCVLDQLPKETTRKLLSATEGKLGMVAGRANADGWCELKVLTASSTVAERRLVEAVAAPLLAFAAGGQLSRLAEWQHLARDDGDAAWGECKVSAPARPPEKWSAAGERSYDVEESNAFEHALRNRPVPWDVRIRADGKLQIMARPRVAAHRAAEALIRGRPVDGAALRIEWVIDTQRSALITGSMSSFSIPTSMVYERAPENPPFFKAGKVLYERQARALGRMLQIDDRGVAFDEFELSDHSLSNGIGWTLKVKAICPTPLRGGVLADAVGAGKTVCAVALIAARVKEARKMAKASADLRHSGATLVVAPVHCLKPVWHQMLEEFTSGLKHLVIEQLDDLLKMSVNDLREADVVIVACELLYNLKQRQHEAYQTHLTELVGDEPLPGFLRGRRQTRLIGSEPDVLTGVWVPNTSQDPFGKSAARQEDRDTAAFFTARYSGALEKLRAMEFEGERTGVPIEWFTWERLIIDECHESLVMSQEDAERDAAHARVHAKEESKMEKEKRKCAQRELLGIGQADLTRRPLRARKSTWGLTGTPLLSSETRITELAALCGGTYVCGNAAHWRTMERASTRDVFLRYHESASSLIYLEERTRAAQEYIDAAVQRNRIDNELKHIAVKQELVECPLPADSAYQSLLSAKKLLPNFSPSFEDVKSEVTWDSLLGVLAEAPSRGKVLCDLIGQIHAEDEWTKIIVFAPAGAAFRAASDALRQLGRPVIIGDPNDAGSTDAIDQFSRPDICDPSRPLVLLMSFDYSSALNLQYVSHHIVFYAPLWGEDPNGVHAAANEQQAIGRVVRIGQTKDVAVHRLVAVGPTGEKTLEARVIERNTSERVTRQAVIA
ncbi:hypothetical protein AB1Y20_004000 [Prymnesium parvum]|uniref:Helicase ATP-binding domain-containing protein n=1 Tax=Prymnesium parvum TaxID=97485 RepID=A0AB34J8Y1_PRYPA